ncbi:MAG: isoprenylcysteine carboxylmethyltransferase family protein [Anaerolineae bacterium]|nr:isoprenylcysteine carboxylmethyltransferase family protein [Anaerolineae bacterium]
MLNTIVFIFITMVAFAIIHSLTADARFKAWVAATFGQRAYEGWYRLIYNALSFVMIMPITAYVFLGGDVLFQPSDSLRPIFLILQAIGLAGAGFSLLQIDLLRFVGLKQVYAWATGKALPLAAEKLQTDGIYRYVRHPLYLFSLMILWTTVPMTDRIFVYNMAATLYFFIGGLWLEEKRMLHFYGDDYASYRERVPALVPFTKRLHF